MAHPVDPKSYPQISFEPLPEPGTFKPYRPRPSREYIKSTERVIDPSYDLWDKVRPHFTGRREFEGRLELEVPAGRYVCVPLFGGLVKLSERGAYRPYSYLVLVVACGPHQGKLVAKYWRYGDDPASIFARDCKDMGLKADWLDRGCGFRSGGVVVGVAPTSNEPRAPVEVAYMASLANLVPEEIWPSESDKPSVKKARAQAMRSAVAAAASLNAAGAGHEQHGASRVNANVPPAAP
jgi:hypothetical protein